MNTNYFISLIAAISIGGAAGYIGSLMATKKMSLVGDVLSHVALPGIGLGLLYGVNISFGALSSLVLGILLIWLLSLKTELSMESLVGVVFTFSLAVGFLITPEEELLHSLFGNISTSSFSDAVMAVFISIVVSIAAKIIYSKMMLAYVSEDLALAAGVKINKYNLIYLFLIAAVVAFGIKIGGTLLTSALIIIPAAVARNVSRNMRQYSFLSIMVGITSAVAGFAVFPYLADKFGLSSIAIGPVIILISIFFFIASLISKVK